MLVTNICLEDDAILVENVKPVETVQDVNIVFTMVEAVVYVEDRL